MQSNYINVRENGINKLLEAYNNAPKEVQEECEDIMYLIGHFVETMDEFYKMFDGDTLNDEEKVKEIDNILLNLLTTLKSINN